MTRNRRASLRTIDESELRRVAGGDLIESGGNQYLYVGPGDATGYWAYDWNTAELVMLPYYYD